MININAQIIFFPVQKLIAITIVYHIWYQCALMSEITLNITLHCSNCNRLLRHIVPYSLLMININTQIIFFTSQKLIAINILFHNSYQCVIMSDVTLHITLYGSHCIRLLRHFIPKWWLMININAHIIIFHSIN